MRILYTLLMMFMLTGCTTVKYVYRDKIVYRRPPSEVIDSNITIPKISVDRDTYVLAKPIRRENILSNYIIELLHTVNKYSLVNSNIKKWYADLNTTMTTTATSK